MDVPHPGGCDTHLSPPQHPLFLLSFGVLTLSTGDSFLVQELLSHGSLRDRLDRRQQTPTLPWLSRPKIAWQVAAALSHLSTQCSREGQFLGSPFIVSSDDIFLGHRYDAKISLPEVLLTMVPSNDPVPPECRCVLSLGLVMAELLTGRNAKPCPAVLREAILERVPTTLRLETAPEVAAEELVIVDPTVRVTWPLDHCRRFASVVRVAFAQDSLEVQTIEGALAALLAQPHESCASCQSSPAGAPLQCGHRCLCVACFAHALEQGEECPICRSPLNPKPSVFSKNFVPRPSTFS